MPTHIPLGRRLGIDDTQLAHLGDEPLPAGLYDEAQQAIIRFAQRSTRMDPIDDELFADLSRHFDTRQLMELLFTVGISNIVNRFHALFRTPLDDSTVTQLGASCPLPLPPEPAG